MADKIKSNANPSVFDGFKLHVIDMDLAPDNKFI